MLQEQIFLPPGYRYITSIRHLNVTSFMADVLFHMLQVDKMGIVCAEEIAVGEEFLVLLEVTRNQVLDVTFEIKPRITAVRFNADDLPGVQVFHPAGSRDRQL